MARDRAPPEVTLNGPKANGMDLVTSRNQAP